MRVYKDISLSEFEPWSGAINTMETLELLEDVTGKNVFDIVESCIDDCGEEHDETEINDILWFETDAIAEWLGYDNWEHLEAVANDELYKYLGLPTNCDIDFDDIDVDSDMDAEEIKDRVIDYLSDEYEYCVCSCDMTVENRYIKVTNIEWDTEE